METYQTLKHLTDNLAQLRDSIEKTARDLSRPAPEQGLNEAGELEPFERAARLLKDYRRRIKLCLPVLPEGAWILLLDLLVHEGRRPISVTSACVGSGMPPTTALRWIQQLVDRGLLLRRADEFDGRRVYLELTPKGRVMLLRYLGA